MLTKKLKNKIERATYTIDATDVPLGRLATKISLLLRGKNKADFSPHLDGGNFVNIKNINEIKFTGKKLEQKKFYHYTGYPGGLKAKKLSELFQKNPSQVLRQAVYQMLPKNKLRSQMIKRLKIE